MGYALGTKWDDNRIKSELKNVMAALGIDRMPSRTEMDSVTHNTALSNKVMKTGGIRYWAENLGLELKNSETTLGNNYEYLAMNLLTNKGYKVNKMTTSQLYAYMEHGVNDISISSGIEGLDFENLCLTNEELEEIMSGANIGLQFNSKSPILSGMCLGMPRGELNAVCGLTL